MTDLSIIIVNYNTHDHLNKCLSSIYEFTKNLNYEIVVVDNNSSNRDVEKFQNKYPNVKFVFLKRNEGFGAGSNIGAKEAKGKNLAFLNPDIILKENSLYELFKYIENNIDVGICSGLLTNNEGIPQYCFNKFPGIKWEFHEAFGILQSKIIKNLLSHSFIVNEEKKEFEVDWFHGACIVIRKEIFLQIGGFDENIFLYYEDVDLCHRVKKLGFRIICLPYIRIFHYERSSVRSETGIRLYNYHMHKSKIYYMQKYFSVAKIIAIKIMYITGSLSKILMLPFRKKYCKCIKQKYQQYIVIIKVHLNIKVNL
jgi:GT2 family glycosyltransferase